MRRRLTLSTTILMALSMFALITGPDSFSSNSGRKLAPLRVG